jgi:hypothetical protein
MTTPGLILVPRRVPSQRAGSPSRSSLGMPASNCFRSPDHFHPGLTIRAGDVFVQRLRCTAQGACPSGTRELDLIASELRLLAAVRRSSAGGARYRSVGLARVEAPPATSLPTACADGRGHWGLRFWCEAACAAAR